VVPLQTVGAVYQLTRVELQELTKQLAPAWFAGGKLHDAHPQDDNRRSVVDYYLGVIRGARQPEVRLNLSHSETAAVQPVKE
jgi:hypothetical protein